MFNFKQLRIYMNQMGLVEFAIVKDEQLFRFMVPLVGNLELALQALDEMKSKLEEHVKYLKEQQAKQAAWKAAAAEPVVPVPDSVVEQASQPQEVFTTE